MKIETLLNFFNENEIENVINYQNRLIDNIKEISKIVFRYFFYLFVIMFLYYLFLESSITSLKFGIIEITELKVIKIFTPPIFSIVNLIVFIGEYRRENLMFQSKVLFNLINKTQLVDEDAERNHFNDFNISFLPFYLPAELNNKLSDTKFWDIVSSLVFVVFLLMLTIVLFIFEFYITKQLYEIWNESLMVKLSFVVTCGVIFISIYFIFKILFTAFNTNKKDKKLWKLMIEKKGNE